MINREDMLELTRRMTPARSHIDRIAGAYYDAEGYIDGTFNTHFLKLSTAEKTKRDFCHLPDLCVYELFPYYRGDCPADQESIL